MILESNDRVPRYAERPGRLALSLFQVAPSPPMPFATRPAPTSLAASVAAVVMAAAAALAAIAALVSCAPSDAAPRAEREAGRRIARLDPSTTRLDPLPFAYVATFAPDDPGPKFLREPDGSSFVPLVGVGRLHAGLSGDRHWLAFVVENGAPEDDWIAEVGPFYTDEIRVVTLAADGTLSETRVGSGYPEGAVRRTLDRWAVPVRLAPGTGSTVYVGYRSDSSLHLDAALVSQGEWQARAVRESVLLGAFIGLLAATAVHAAYMSIAFRRVASAWLLVYALSFGVYALLSKGVLPSSSWFAPRGAPLASCALALSGLMVARAELGTKSLFPRFDAALSALAFLAPVVAAGLAIGDFGRWMFLGGLLEIAVVFLLLGLGVAASVKRVKAAVPFTIAWGFMLLGALATQLGTLGIPLGPWDALWRYGEMIGGAIQCGLLSVGFAGAVDSTKRAGERERDKIIEELERSNRVKEDFLTSMAGAMEAPVVSMERAMARAEEALSRSGDESRSADLAIARVEAARLLSSIGSIEAYVKARNGDFRFSYVKARLAEVVGSAASAARYVSDPSRVRVEVECDDSTAVIDAAALEGFLLKLCLFASARTARGVVRIEGRFGGGFVELAVSDPGDEPPAAARGAVDDPLARFEPSMGRYGAFATINLFVIRASVEAMGGSFAYSRADGRNRFSISLPDRAEASAAVGESAGAHGHGEHGGIDAVRAALVRDPAGECPSGTALVVSADEVSLASLKVALEAAGFRVIAATGADRAALAARESGVDIAIVRASLPGTSGYELCGQLRSAARPDSAPLPILLLLETDRAEDAAEAYRAGASDFVSMRSSERALVARALTLVRLKRLVEESVREARSLAEFDHLRRLGMLVAGVAHEVNTPNNAVFRDVPVLKRAWCELEPILADYFGRNPGLMIGAWDWAAARESIPEMLDDMYRASQQIRKIVDDLKSYVARPGPRPAERVDLAAACAFAARLLEQKIRAVGARVELRPSDGIFARGDPWKVAQIAVNLLENALDAVEARADPSIELRVLSRDGRAALECADSGPGIPEADLAKLFEPFFTTKGSRGGLGLGLPISRDYAREMGGDLSFRPGPSGGTVATLELPADGGSDAR